MSAARRISFKIPLQSEVQVYMKQRKGWPETFCQWYAEKFWNHYTSNGWKVGGKAAMKDWRAAFNSQWQDLKTADVKEAFLRFGGRPEPAKVVHMMQPKQEMVQDNDTSRLDQLLAAYSKNPTSYSIEKFAHWQGLNDCYRAIKENRLWPDDLKLSEMAKYDEKNCKAFVIVRTLDWYGCKGWSFSDTLKIRNANK